MKVLSSFAEAGDSLRESATSPDPNRRARWKSGSLEPRLGARKSHAPLGPGPKPGRIPGVYAAINGRSSTSVASTGKS